MQLHESMNDVVEWEWFQNFVNDDAVNNVVEWVRFQVFNVHGWTR